MVQRQGHPISLCVLVPLVSALLLFYSAPCQAQTIIQFWYADIGDGDQSKADMVMPNGKYGIATPAQPGDVTDATTYGNTIRGSSTPPGTNVEYIKWDQTEADKAKVSAERCDTTPGNGNEIVVASTTPMTYAEALDKIRRECQDRSNLCSKSCLQYSMLMTAGVNKFGCASAQCADTAAPYRVHCFLEPKSAIKSGSCSQPYDTNGQPCEKCPRDKGYCYNNLCVSHQDTQEIVRNTPAAIVTCSAPCRNCGVRKDEKNQCFCQCEAGTSGVSCEQGSTTATCGKCAQEGNPCLNNGADAGESSCRCLCPYEFAGPRCQYPRNVGPRITVTGRPSPPCQGKGCKDMVPSVGEVVGPVLEGIKKRLADELNKFCMADQTNYIKCCGVGTLPTTGPRDFVTPENIQIPPSLIGYRADGKMEAPIQVTAPGNNGLCRKRVRDSTMQVPIPRDVLQTVMQSTLNPCCGGVRLDYVNQVSIPGIASTVNTMVVTIS